MDYIELTATTSDAGERLDKFIAAACGLSRAAAQTLIADGNVLLAGEPVAKSHIVQAGEGLSVRIPPPEEIEAVPQDIPLNVVYEDEHLLVVDKPKGMVVHPAAGNPDGTLVNALLYHCRGGLSGIGGKIRPGIVHRIDKDTSGLLVVAKDDATHNGLSEQFSRHSIHREYHTVVYGSFRHDDGTVNAPIGRSTKDRKKMAVAGHGGKHAVTHYEVLARYNGFSYVAARLETGRTHQIRVHMAHIGHPVAGDAVYGPKKVLRELDGQCLHAKRLGFVHPESGEWMEFDSELPPYFKEFIGKLERNTPT